MGLDLEQYRMRCAECGTPLTQSEALAWLAQWREICREADAIEDEFRAQGTSVRLYEGLDGLLEAKWFPPCDRCRAVAQDEAP